MNRNVVLAVVIIILALLVGYRLLSNGTMNSAQITYPGDADDMGIEENLEPNN